MHSSSSCSIHKSIKMKQKLPNQSSLDLPSLVTTLAEKHMNSPLKPAQKELLMNRLNQLRLKTPDHPPYSAMILKALVKLSGSSEEAISKFIENEYKNLPVAHLTFLKHHLAKLCKYGEIILTDGNKYVIAQANQSLKVAIKSKELPAERIVELISEKGQEKGTKLSVQQKELSLKTTVKITKRPDKVIQKHSNPKELKVLEPPPRRSKRLQTGFKQENDVKKIDLFVEPLIDKCIQIHGPRNLGRKSAVRNLPVKTVFKWDLEKKQRRLNKLLAQENNQMNNDKVSKNRLQDVENESIQEKRKVFAVEVPMKKICRKRVRGPALLSEKPRRSKRLQNDFKHEKQAGEKNDFLVESDLSLISELQQHVHGDRDTEIEPNVVVRKWEGIKVYRRRSKEDLMAKKVEPRICKTQSSPVCIDVKDNQSLGSWISAKKLLQCNGCEI